jgi:hypothetical protein
MINVAASRRFSGRRNNWVTGRFAERLDTINNADREGRNAREVIHG